MRRPIFLLKQPIELFQKNFLTGVFVLIPFAVVAWLLLQVFSALWSFQNLIPEDLQPIRHFEPFIANLLNLAITVALTATFLLLVSLFGWASKQYLGGKVLGLLGHFIQRIPVIRAVYSSLSQLLQTVSAGGSKQFNRVVYVEYPRKGCWALGFVTSQARGLGPEVHLNLYIPTTPNPTSGFHLMVPESEVRDSHMTVEDAFKTILSLGIAQSSDQTSPGFSR